MKQPKPVKAVAKKAKHSQAFWLKTTILVIATALSLLGSVGQFLFIESYDDLVSARAAEMRDIENRVATLRSTQTEYFNSYVQGNLLFALNPADVSVNKGVTAQMFQLAILDRAYPFRAIMAEMAMSGLFDFKTTNDKYRSISEKARADFSYSNYDALNQFEKQILDGALSLQHTLQDRFFAAQTEKADAEAARDKRRLWLTLMTAIGTILLLFANLVEERKKAA